MVPSNNYAPLEIISQPPTRHDAAKIASPPRSTTILASHEHDCCPIVCPRNNRTRSPSTTNHHFQTLKEYTPANAASSSANLLTVSASQQPRTRHYTRST
jgi:hypothetical protein